MASMFPKTNSTTRFFRRVRFLPQAAMRRGLDGIIARQKPLALLAVVVEATGEFNNVVAASLAAEGLPVIVANPAQVRASPKHLANAECALSPANPARPSFPRSREQICPACAIRTRTFSATNRPLLCDLSYNFLMTVSEGFWRA